MIHKNVSAQALRPSQGSPCTYHSLDQRPQATRYHAFTPSQVGLRGLRPTPARGWSQKQIIPGGGNMRPEEEVVDDETVLGEEEIEPFDWEDLLYETWLEEQREQKRSKRTDAGL